MLEKLRAQFCSSSFCVIHLVAPTYVLYAYLCLQFSMRAFLPLSSRKKGFLYHVVRILLPLLFLFLPEPFPEPESNYFSSFLRGVRNRGRGRGGNYAM